MDAVKMKRIYLYSRFERIWHWLQALLIIALIVTGLEIHGAYKLFGYEEAVKIHSFLGLTWGVLFVFIVFWVLTTGEWRQYVPTTKKLFAVMWYYSFGIFQGKPHPVQKTPGAKHNPLQRLTYLGLVSIMLPVQMVAGLLYYTYNQWPQWGLDRFLSLGGVAALHTALTFMLLAFLVIHVYMTTTGHTIFAHIRSMISGWEEVCETTEVYDWETTGKKKPLS